MQFAHVAQLEDASGLSPVQVLGSNPIVGTKLWGSRSMVGPEILALKMVDSISSCPASM